MQLGDLLFKGEMARENREEEARSYMGGGGRGWYMRGGGGGVREVEGEEGKSRARKKIGAAEFICFPYKVRQLIFS